MTRHRSDDPSPANGAPVRRSWKTTWLKRSLHIALIATIAACGGGGSSTTANNATGTSSGSGSGTSAGGGSGTGTGTGTTTPRHEPGHGYVHTRHTRRHPHRCPDASQRSRAQRPDARGNHSHAGERQRIELRQAAHAVDRRPRRRATALCHEPRHRRHGAQRRLCRDRARQPLRVRRRHRRATLESLAAPVRRNIRPRPAARISRRK